MITSWNTQKKHNTALARVSTATAAVRAFLKTRLKRESMFVDFVEQITVKDVL